MTHDPEYKGEQDIIYNKFLANVEKTPYKSKIEIRRG